MVGIVPPPPTLQSDAIELYYVVDELLARSPILIFYGPTATPTAGASNSRIQAHIFSPAGLKSYPRIIVSPSNPDYSSVQCLPREEQGDDVCRGLAFSLYQYFKDLEPAIKEAWEAQPTALGSLRSTPALFSDAHAAILASRMVRVENVKDIIKDVRQALAEQSLSWLDLDIILPPGSMKPLELGGRDSILPHPSDEDIAFHRYGEYAPLVKLFGESAFLPTSRLRRAPSKPTVLNRGANFTRQQKENIRREMCELLDTEESYVSKLYDLVHSVAADFRQKARTKRATSTSPTEDALAGLFPPSLDQILEMNSGFLEALRKAVEDTENDAIQDIESTGDQGTIMPSIPTRTDVTGTLAVATIMKTWFPKFASCYVEYTLKHGEFGNNLRTFMKDTGSSFSKRMQDTGEQRLMSMLIEPIQRLPRYNLYIDNLIKQLPARHPALNSLLKARDTVVEICSHDTSATEPSKVLLNLRNVVPNWPQTLVPRGRLISAIDAVELHPPYRKDVYGPRSTYEILLLFPDVLVVLEKSSKQSTTARSLMAQLDGTDVLASERGESRVNDIVYRQTLELHSFDLTEMDSGKLVQLQPFADRSKGPQGPRRPGSSRPGSLTGDSLIQVFHLVGPYEGKASRVIEELVRARVEGRFSDTERESHKWEVRSASSADLSLFAAMFEKTHDKSDGRGVPARVRVVVDGDKGSLGKHGPDVAASITVVGEGYYRLEITSMAFSKQLGWKEQTTVDNLTAVECLPVLSKRLSNFLQMRSRVWNPAVAGMLLLRNQHILQSIKIVTEESHEHAVRERVSRPHSPVKMLSNLFGGAVSRDYGSLRKQNQPTPVLTEVPQISPPVSRPSSNDGPSKATSPTQLVHAAADALTKLEETLQAYVVLLDARKGNVVGRILRTRASADELAVNEIYNTLLEDGENIDGASLAPIDVLFSAFEKFVKVAWYDKIGPIISRSTWREIQSKLDGMYPGDFEEFFCAKFGEMSPQNQRALRKCIKLLADLLSSTSNDSDRGVLTASFAEVLVPDGNPNDVVLVLDRLVEDIETLLGEAAPGVQATTQGSVSDGTRTRATNTGSLTSNTSLRKKFGFGTLTRKSSKLQQSDGSEKTDLGSVWRALSKSKHGNDQSASMSKASALGNIGRSNSTDVNNRQSPKRPVSRDRPTVLGTFPFEPSKPLGTIGEGAIPGGPPRKKRRSSISDLRSLQAEVQEMPSLIPTPSGSPKRAISPARETSPIRQVSPLRIVPKEEVTITSHEITPTRRRRGIPTLKSPPAASGRKAITTEGLFERPTAGNALRKPPISQEKAPSTKLRMQSPQKLRERLQNEKQAIQEADNNLQAELSKISEELKIPGTKTTPLETKLASLTTKQATAIAALTTRLETLSSDVTSSLQVSENRVKKLDELLRQSQAENDAVYQRVNDELAEIFSTVHRGEGVAAMKEKMKADHEEAARLRKENARLKRENVGLRAQMKN